MLCLMVNILINSCVLFVNNYGFFNSRHKSLDDMTEKNLSEITIHDVDPLALTLLVNFSYTGELSVCEDNVQVNLTLALLRIKKQL